MHVVRLRDTEWIYMHRPSSFLNHFAMMETPITTKFPIKLNRIFQPGPGSCIASTGLGSIKNLLLVEEVETMKGDAMKAALNLRKWICVQQLSRVGGSSVRDCVNKVIDH
ncbi:hypothetical protein QQF64_018589 [Cirrhinus molitorella]|uniref:Uncharacterized protein n=1 Tax=Cirrhinus molitorella TaxID=172907 RepID=A0ABR3LDA3_9TELE